MVRLDIYLNCVLAHKRATRTSKSWLPLCHRGRFSPFMRLNDTIIATEISTARIRLENDVGTTTYVQIRCTIEGGVSTERGCMFYMVFPFNSRCWFRTMEKVFSDILRCCRICIHILIHIIVCGTLCKVLNKWLRCCWFENLERIGKNENFTVTLLRSLRKSYFDI